MAPSSTDVKASATFDVRPVRSQVVLVGLTVAAIIALLIGGGLLAIDKTSGWPFVAISAALCTAVVLCWQQSQRDTDLEESHPTEVVLPNGANFSTDSRLLSSQEGVRNFAQVVVALALRQPLPEPSGLTGPGGILIPNSKHDALSMIAGINAETQKLHDQAISLLQKQLTSDSVSQTLDEAKGLPQDATIETGTHNAIFTEPSSGCQGTT